MSFKAQADLDIRSVFLNFEEFGEAGEIAGHEPVAMIIENEETAFPAQSSDDRPGVACEWVTVHVAVADVPDRLLPGRATTFLHEKWFVSEVAESGGMKVIKLYRETA